MGAWVQIGSNPLGTQTCFVAPETLLLLRRKLLYIVLTPIISMWITSNLHISQKSVSVGIIPWVFPVGRYWAVCQSPYPWRALPPELSPPPAPPSRTDTDTGSPRQNSAQHGTHNIRHEPFTCRQQYHSKLNGDEMMIVYIYYGDPGT